MESNDGGDTVAAEEPPPADRDGNTSRILLISERGIPGTQTLGVTGWTEAEDVLVSHGGADLHELRRRGDVPDVRVRRMLGHLLRRSSRSGVLVPPLARPSTPIEGRYDVAIAVMYSVWNLPLLERIRGLRRAADTVVAWFPEVWPSQLTSRLATQPFAVCGEIVVGEPQSAERLSRILGRTVHFVPLATDVERFAVEGTDSPLAAPDAGRPIAVTNIGRRDERLHANLMAWSRATGNYYVFDTIKARTVPDVHVHRWAMAQQLRRTAVAITSYARHDEPDVVGRLRWVPSRVFESMAGGAVLAGLAPDPLEQRKLFGREVVHPLPEEPVRATQIIADLVATADAGERWDNVRSVMAGHDWSHRWISLLGKCGISVPGGLRERAQRLSRAAARGREINGGVPDAFG